MSAARWGSLFLTMFLVACQGAVTGGEGAPTAVEAPPPVAPQGNYASQDGVLGSQPAPQDVSQTYAYNLRFPGESLNSGADIGKLFYYAKQDQDKFPAGLVEKVIHFPIFQHDACCAGRWVRAVDLGALPVAEGNTEADKAYHTFTKLVTGGYDWASLAQARYRDYSIGGVDASGQNVNWQDLGLKLGNFYSFFLLPEGQAPQESWKNFDSKETLLGLYLDNTAYKLRDLRVVPAVSLIQVQPMQTSVYVPDTGSEELEN